MRQKSGIHRSESWESIQRRIENFFFAFTPSTHTLHLTYCLTADTFSLFISISGERIPFVFPSLEKRFRKNIQLEMTLSIMHTYTPARAPL